MAIISVTIPKVPARTGSKNRLWQRTYSQVFRVITSAETVGPMTVMSAVDPITTLAIPNIGEYYSNGFETDSGAFVEAIEAREENESQISWLVTVTYGPYDAAIFSTNPTDWPCKLTFSANKYERVLWVDRDGHRITNSADERFKDPVTVDDSRSVITVERNELISGFDPTLAELYRDTTNIAPWNGFDIDCVKCASITTSQPQYDSNNLIWYYTVTYVFEINRDTWAAKVLDQGFSILDGSSPPKRVLLKDKDNHPRQEATPLDGSGHELATNGTAVFLSINGYPQSDFTAFNIDFAAALGR